jgi:ketosteroid isomerase-like protein
MREQTRALARVRYFSVLFLILTVASGIRGGQKSGKSKNSENASKQAGPLPLPVTDQIEYDIGEMLGAFQIGELEMMHKHYADNATFVSGAFEPPVVGWQNYAAMYVRQRAAFQGTQVIRRNTYVFTHGDTAWASYQWELIASLNGKPYSAQGQTTLVFVKVGEAWLIVHNHTSQICPLTSSAPQQPEGQSSSPQTPAQGSPASVPVKH